VQLALKGVFKSFGDNHVLKGVSLECAPRGVTIILGGSGTGKSVTLRLLTGLMRPNQGQVLVDGTDITGLSERELYPIRAKMGYIFQFGGLLHSMDVGENVGLAMLERGQMNRSDIARIVAEKLKLVGLEGKESERPSNLSGGMKKRVAIARALANDPEVILYDEPTAGLDPPTSDAIDQLIASVANDMGKPSIVVTHDMRTVFTIGRLVHFLHEGKIIFSGSPEEFAKSNDPHARAFLARDQHLTAPIHGAVSSAAETNPVLGATKVSKPNAEATAPVLPAMKPAPTTRSHGDTGPLPR